MGCFGTWFVRYKCRQGLCFASYMHVPFMCGPCVRGSVFLNPLELTAKTSMSSQQCPNKIVLPPAIRVSPLLRFMRYSFLETCNCTPKEHEKKLADLERERILRKQEADKSLYDIYLNILETDLDEGGSLFGSMLRYSLGFIKGEMAEWSKALVLGTSLFGGVGSNPTLVMVIVLPPFGAFSQ
ncbi:putative ATP synthase e chain, mitochondrial [Dirofilaria immitis]|nr:putative ATP synthase e chain, mitochondrial [Dirofilaria immitis]